MPIAAATNAAHHSRIRAGAKAARFHDSTGPIDIAKNSGIASGSTVELKNGAPTLICAPATSCATSEVRSVVAPGRVSEVCPP